MEEVTEEFGPEHAKANEIANANKGAQLGDAEIAVINHLANAFNTFVQLQEFHPSDQREFEQAIHVCQHIVMSRVAVRSNPELFHVQP